MADEVGRPPLSLHEKKAVSDKCGNDIPVSLPASLLAYVAGRKMGFKFPGFFGMAGFVAGQMLFEIPYSQCKRETLIAMPDSDRGRAYRQRLALHDPKNQLLVQFAEKNPGVLEEEMRAPHRTPSATEKDRSAALTADSSAPSSSKEQSAPLISASKIMSTVRSSRGPERVNVSKRDRVGEEIEDEQQMEQVIKREDDNAKNDSPLSAIGTDNVAADTSSTWDRIRRRAELKSQAERRSKLGMESSSMVDYDSSNTSTASNNASALRARRSLKPSPSSSPDDLPPPAQTDFTYNPKVRKNKWGDEEIID